MLFLRKARHLGRMCDLLGPGRPCGGLRAVRSLNAPAGVDIVDAADRILFPSFVDAHVHLREPGFEWKEDVRSGA